MQSTGHNWLQSRFRSIRFVNHEKTQEKWKQGNTLSIVLGPLVCGGEFFLI